MAGYTVGVPQGVRPGQQFLVNVAGQTMKVQCPPNVHPGQQVQINVAPNQQQHQQQQQQSPPPPPSNQCQASLNAEKQLAQVQGAPDASLIFTAMDRSGDNAVDVYELQYGLSHGGRVSFDLKTCQLLVNMYDIEKKGHVNKNQFVSLWGYLDQWRSVFNKHDKDKSGTVNKAELWDSLGEVGYRFSQPFFEHLYRTYDRDKTGAISFDEFIQLFCELHSLTEGFKKHDTERKGIAEFRYEDFLQAAYIIHE